jgi:hypothetical protein
MPETDEFWFPSVRIPVQTGVPHRNMNDLQAPSQIQNPPERTASPASPAGLQSSPFGFRVATIPEPSTYALTAIGVIGLLAFRRRTR